ncbi:MAG: lanthionine synthetase LanC family protein [Acidobacteriota bacterium]
MHTSAPEITAVHRASDRQRRSFIEAAVQLGSDIVQHQTTLPNDDVSWNVERMPGLGKPPQVTPIGAHLYEGRAGIGVFFAALEQEEPGAEWRARSLAAVEPTRRVLRKVLASPERRESLDLGVGGIYGIGGLIYSFARMGTFLDDASLLEDARALTGLLTPQRFTKQTCDDLVMGTAGAVCALLVLHELSPAPLADGETPLEIAVRAGDKLLADRVEWDGRPRAWKSSMRFPPLAGFSHGAAGVVYALDRLQKVTGDRRYLDAAEEGLAFERTAYSAPHQNWLDLRVDPEKSKPRVLNNWCHGAPGILLGRVLTFATFHDEEIHRELEVAIATTEGQPLTPADHVCCGNLGRAEILHDAGTVLDRPDLLDAAYELAEVSRARALENGHYGWQLLRGFEPSFFSGAAGAGYAFLRLAKPSLPSVLSLL